MAVGATKCLGFRTDIMTQGIRLKSHHDDDSENRGVKSPFHTNYTETTYSSGSGSGGALTLIPFSRSRRPGLSKGIRHCDTDLIANPTHEEQ